MTLCDEYIVTDKVNKVYNYIINNFNNKIIRYMDVDYQTNIKLYGNYISSNGYLFVYGKLLISKNNEYIRKCTRIRISKKFEKVVRKINNKYSINVDSSFNFSIMYKERLYDKNS